METTYRILTWVLMGAAFLLLMPIFACVCQLLPQDLMWLTNIILPLIYCFLLFCGWKRRIKKDIIAEPEKISRRQSSFIWFGTALIAFPLLKICFLYCNFNYFSGISTEYILLALLSAATVSAIIFLPFKKHVKGMDFASDGIIAGIVINLFVLAFAPVNYAYQGEKLPRHYKMSPQMQVWFFPKGAKHFEITGASAFFCNHVKWNCHVSEKDFETFRKKSGYDFVLINNDTSAIPLQNTDKNWSKPYYFYNKRHANGGGLTMRYSVSEQKLYGNYSNR